MATAAVSGPSGLKGYLATHRTLETYPVGAHRWAMLMLTVLATIISFYEFQFAPLLPLWIPTLHFSLENFTVFLLLAVLLFGRFGDDRRPLPIATAASSSSTYVSRSSSC